MHFPTNSGLIFLTGGLTNDKYLIDTGATLSIIANNSNYKPPGPLLKGANALPIPFLGFLTKAVQFQRKLFTFHFLQAAVAGPILRLDFLKNSKSLLLLIPAKFFLLTPAFLPSILRQPPGTPAPPGPADSSPLSLPLVLDFQVNTSKIL
jgi:hypothetical protein